jgi:hypothetical protein
MRRCVLALAVTALLLSVLSCGGSAAPLVFSPDQLPEAGSGRAYEVSILVSGNHTPIEQLSLGAGTLPLGLTFTRGEDGQSAIISGTPQEVGSFEFAVRASCLGTNETGQAGEQAYTLIVR